MACTSTPAATEHTSLLIEGGDGTGHGNHPHTHSNYHHHQHDCDSNAKDDDDNHESGNVVIDRIFYCQYYFYKVT
jgi:hypothetical protein